MSGEGKGESEGRVVRASQEGRAVTCTCTPTQSLRSIARTVTVLHQGSVLAEGTMDQVSNDPDVIKVYLGEEA